MKKNLFCFVQLSMFICFYVAANAQLPSAGSNIVYMANGSTIYNYDPTQAISASNPTTNSISILPASIGGLAVGDNINASSPTLTFYVVVPIPSSSSNYYYHYYNGSTWVNTGHLAGNSYNIGAGGGYIYDLTGNGQVWKYDGSGNAIQILNLGVQLIADITADCAGNFYLLKNYGSPVWFNKYDPYGNLLNTWTLSGTYPTGGGACLSMIDDTVYFTDITTLYKGIISGTNVTCSVVGTLSFSQSDFATLPIATSNNGVLASVDTLKYCDSGNMQVSASGGGPYTWSVISGTATITGGGAAININASANATIVLGVATGSICGHGTDTIRVIVNPGPAAMASSNSPVCKGDSLYLYVGTTSGATYSWTGPNSFLSALANPWRAFVPFADSGNYIITVTKNSCSKSDTEHVVIKPLPNAPTAGSNSPLCAGDTILLTGSSSTSGVTYGWQGPGAYTSTQQNPAINNVSTGSTGDYIVTATLNGCIAKDTVHVDVFAIPTQPIAGSNSPVCAGSSIMLTVNTITGATYGWSGPGSYGSTSQNPVRTNAQFSDSGKYMVTVTVNGCTSEPDTVNMSINPTIVPSVSITTNPTPVHVGQSATYTANPTNGGTPPTWAWKKNGIILSGATNNTYTYTPAPHDTICVVMHSNATCPMPDTAKACDVAPLRVNELIGQNDEWVIWPNPVSDELNVEIVRPDEPFGRASYLAMTGHEAVLRVFNILGQEVFVGQATNKGETRINTKDWNSGMYIVEITDKEGNRVIKKIVKQ